jgi:M6 family metalloprotease-like protein
MRAHRSSSRVRPRNLTGPLAAALVVALWGTIGASCALAAPYDGEPFELRQPDGAGVAVLVWGDEYYQHVESPDGYTLVRDPISRIICYARLDASGQSLVSTGVPAGDPALATLGLPQHLRIPPAARRAQAVASRQQLEIEMAAVLDKDLTRDPQPSCLGDVQGITLIIDFSDQVATVPAANFAAYLNQVGYNGYGNNGSVRDYYFDVSDSALTYTNYSPPTYYRAANPKVYYEDPNIPYGQRARELVREALINLNNSGFDFSQYDANRDGYVDALNVFYAGTPSQGWSVGLWPHSGVISYAADGVSTYRYQITNIGTSLTLATFCHENGHMICFWPDLYDYGSDSAGVGAFCLMCSTGAATNPIQPCAPLKDLAGWTGSLTLLQGLMSGAPVDAGYNQFYKLPHPSNTNEYYMLENRRRGGRDASIPDSGIAIWHVDLAGSNNNQQQTPSLHYFCTLVQADGRWDLENNRNNGDATDLWAAPGYVEFTPQTSPAATWWSGQDAAMYIDGISTIGAVMTFNYREGLGTMGVTIDVGPGDLPGPWRLEGPGGFLETGAGDRNLMVWTEGTYTLTWLTLPGWTTPVPAVASGNIVNGGAPLTFAGVYTNPPFAAVTTAPLGDTGVGRGVSCVDFDGDGDLDLYVCNRGSANRLLRNDGNLVFTDVATGLLADPGLDMAAAWADFDNDGDQDVYLTRDGQANLLLEQGAGGTFTNIAQFGTEDAGAGRAASWSDYDGDGRLDLYLVNYGTANQLFRSYGDIGFGHFVFFPVSSFPLQDTGPGTAAPWADFDLDGDRDLYLVNYGAPNVLIENWNGTTFQVRDQMSDGNNGQAAAWGDVDGDNDLDLYLVNDGQADVLYRNDGAYYTVVNGPALGDTGHGRGVALADFDNDGNLDFYVARYNEQDLLAFGDGNGHFAGSSLALAETGGACTAVACGDVDGDGGLDLYVSRDNQAKVLLRNSIVSRGHWLHLDLQGDGTNSDAIGARVRVVAGGRSQVREVSAGGESLAQHARRVAFGLGSATVADSVIVHWPAGATRVLTGVAVDRILVVTENPSTSAPDSPPPATTALWAPQPNPFNPTTTLSFDLAQAGAVEVAIYALDGRRVATLVRENRAAGHNTVEWHGSDDSGRGVASGTYLCRLRTNQGNFTQRLTLVR